MDQRQLEHLQKINQYWKEIFSNLSVLNKINKDEDDDEVNPYIAQLAMLRVSNNSVFRDMVWDYDEDTENRAASVTLSAVQLNFSRHMHIPLGVITEIKCLFLAVNASPKDFGHRKNEIKPNTLISTFQRGLSFLDFVFSELQKRLGEDYVQFECNKLSKISLLDFEEAAAKTTLAITRKKKGKLSAYQAFFDYLNTQKAKQVVGIECDADFDVIRKAYEKGNKKKYDSKSEKLPYLETNIFDLTLRKASFNVVSFLKSVDEKVNDPVMEQHYDVLATMYEKFPYSKKEFHDYGAYRLSQQGYSITYINTAFPENEVAKLVSNVPVTISMVNTRFRNKYESSNIFRVSFNKAYLSAQWVIGTLMGARPNVYSDLKLDGCLDLEDKTIVSEEHKGRDNRWNLFNDRWVAIPIIIDAFKVIELIGGKIFQKKYVFSSTYTLSAGEINTPTTSLSWITEQAFSAITGLSLKDINSKLNGYVFRHSLAHQMYRADVGLPIISYQLKHIVSATDALSRKGKVSQTTLGYGGIANQLTNDQSKSLDMRHAAELEAIKANFDPTGKYMGGKADEHILTIKKFFNGCMEAGYSEDEIYEAMVKQGLAIINVGSGYCFGGVENFDETLPCIGGLRCNPPPVSG